MISTVLKLWLIQPASTLVKVGSISATSLMVTIQNVRIRVWPGLLMTDTTLHHSCRAAVVVVVAAVVGLGTG